MPYSICGQEVVWPWNHALFPPAIFLENAGASLSSHFLGACYTLALGGTQMWGLFYQDMVPQSPQPTYCI